MPPIQFAVDRKEAGHTLAAVLKARFRLSWSQAKRLVDGRHVRVSGQIETDIARRLKTGKPITIDQGAVEVPKPPGGGKRQVDKETRRQGDGKKTDPKVPPARGAKKPEPTPAAKAAKPPRPASKPTTPPPAPRRASPIDVDLVYVDDAIVVANKPAGLTTMRHTEEAAEFGDHGQRFLTRTLAGLLPSLLGAPGRPVFAVHRLDRDTSGLVVFARTEAAAAALTAQFRRHAIDRRYVALTRGVPAGGKVESVLVRDRGDGRRGSGAGPDGKRAVTHVKVAERLGAFARVECRLETGRTHQIRIHLGEAGAPLCGETVYDRPVNGQPAADGSGATRPMLHATRLGFKHPETGEPVGWEAAPPADFAALLEKLRARAS